MSNRIYGIRFCRCKEVNKDGVMTYWQLHISIAAEQIITMGMPIYGYYVSTNRAPKLRGMRKALDSGTAFDFAHTPKEGDHLSIHIADEADGVSFESPMPNIGYVYKDGKWRYKEYDGFTLLWERVDAEMGCVG
jgi:hypothetical protein